MRGNGPRWRASTYWATDDDLTTGTVDLVWPRPIRLDRLVLQEAITLGQRVEAWAVEVDVDCRWAPFATGTTRVGLLADAAAIDDLTPLTEHLA